MADDHHYDAGTLNDYTFDEFRLIEEDGEVVIEHEESGDSVAFPKFGLLLGSARDAPTSDELDDGESMVYLDSTSGDLMVAKYDGASVSTATVATFA